MDWTTLCTNVIHHGTTVSIIVIVSSKSLSEGTWQYKHLIVINMEMAWLCSRQAHTTRCALTTGTCVTVHLDCQLPKIDLPSAMSCCFSYVQYAFCNHLVGIHEWYAQNTLAALSQSQGTTAHLCVVAICRPDWPYSRQTHVTNCALTTAVVLLHFLTVKSSRFSYMTLLFTQGVAKYYHTQVPDNHS